MIFLFPHDEIDTLLFRYYCVDSESQEIFKALTYEGMHEIMGKQDLLYCHVPVIF